MNKKPVLQLILFVSIVIANITTILKGVKHHENGWVIAGGIGLALILTAIILNVIKAHRDKTVS